jgi:hypothetical protein
MIEHANLFDQAKRAIEREQVDRRSKPKMARVLGGGG